MTGGPWYNTFICKKKNGNVFGGFIKNARTDRYNIMCPIDAHEKEHQSSCYDGSSGKGCPIPSNSTTEALVSLGTTKDFIGYWIKSLKHNVLECCNMYFLICTNCFRK